MRDQPERHWTLRLFPAIASVVAVAAIAVACRDVKPTESIMAIGLKPNPVCFSNPDHTACICPRGEVGVWPNCSQEELPPVVTGDTARVWCTPHSPTRGDTVQCRIYVGRLRKFRVTTRNSASGDPAVVWDRNAARDDSLYLPGDTARWTGPIVLSAVVTVKVSMADSTGLAFDTLTRTADTVIVTARVWPEYQITGSPVEIVGLIGEMTHYPTHWRTPTSTSTVIGQFEWVHLHMFAAFESANSRTTVPWGPNEGLSYFPSPPRLGQDMQTWTHPALFPPGSVGTGNFLDWTWYLQQDGSKFLWPLLSPTDSGNYVTACDSAGVSRLRMQSRGHEGLQDVFSANSHFAIVRNGISSKPVAMWLERVVLSDSTSTLPLNTLVYDSIYNPIFIADTLFEQPEYARIFGANKVYGVRQTDSGAIGCYINTPTFRPPTP